MDVTQLMQSDGLYQTVFPEGWKFLWRVLTLKEYHRFVALRNAGSVHPMVLHSMVFDYCYVGDSNLLNQNIPAGITIAIGECIMWLSGDSGNYQLIEDIAAQRENYPAQSVIEHMKSVCFTAWPSYTYEDIESWSYPGLLKRFAVAEGVLTRRMPDYQPLDLRKLAKENDPKFKNKPAVDYQQENRELDGALGDQTHPLDRAPDELAGLQNKKRGKLNKRRMARQLDQRGR